MRRAKSAQPTDVELQILQVLWKGGPSTARGVHDALSEKKATNYSTTVKMLSIMLDKGLVKRDEAAAPHIYRSVPSRQSTQRHMLRHLIAKAYAGSAGSLVLEALSSQKPSPEELVEIRRLLNDLEEKQK